MAEAVPYLRGERRGRVAVVTFDDGYVDTIEAALPALLRYGHRATCFVVSGEIGRTMLGTPTRSVCASPS